MSPAPIDQFDELLNFKGPKLHRFKNGRHDKIQYLELLSGFDDDGEAAYGDNSYVLKVRIDGEHYALKIVSNLDIKSCHRLVSFSIHDRRGSVELKLIRASSDSLILKICIGS